MNQDAPPRKWANPTPAGSSRKPESSSAASGRRTPPWLWPAAAASVLLLGLVIVWASGPLRNKSNIPEDHPDGPVADRKSPDEHPKAAAADPGVVEDRPIGSVAAKPKEPPLDEQDSVPLKPKGLPLDQQDWVPLFNGKDLTGWKTHSSRPGRWRVENGVLIGGTGPSASHLYSESGDYHDIHLRVEARFHAGSGGVYLRSSFGPGLPTRKPYRPTGYEALINMTSGREHNKTGTLNPGDPDNDDVWRVFSQPRTIPPGRWFTLEAIADDNILSILLDGKLTAYHVDPKRRYVSGHIALQQHDPQTVIEFRKIEIQELKRPGRKDSREIRRFTGYHTRVSTVAFSPDERTILSGGDSEEVATPKNGAETRYPHGNGNLVVLWHTDTGRTVWPPMKGHNHHIASLAYSPDGHYAASTSHWWEDAAKAVMIWDLTTGRQFRRFHYGTNQSEDVWDGAVTFSADSRRVLVAYSNGTVYEWDLETGQQQRQVSVLGGKKWTLNEFPTHRLLARSSPLAHRESSGSRGAVGPAKRRASPNFSRSHRDGPQGQVFGGRSPDPFRRRRQHHPSVERGRRRRTPGVPGR